MVDTYQILAPTNLMIMCFGLENMFMSRLVTIVILAVETLTVEILDVENLAIETLTLKILTVKV